MNNAMLSELIVSILLGGGVGYATNNLAINMLFKKYFGRFGGVIKDHYDEFIQSMSQLVEDDLVNHKTLEQEFNSDAFKKVLQKWISDILLIELPKSSGSNRFEDIPGIDQSVQNLISLAETAQKPFFKNMYGEISKKELCSIISKEQYQYIINENLPLIFKDKESYEYDIKQIFCSFLSNHSINALISNRAVLQIADNINNVIQQTDFSKFDGDLNNAYKELLDAINIDSIIAGIASELAEMRWSEFVKDSKHLSSELFARFFDFIESEQGQDLLLKVVATILKDARKINIKLDEALSPKIKTGLVNFINEKLPGIINKLIDAIRDSKKEIETIIDATLEKELNSSGIGGKILLLVKNTVIDSFIGNLAEKANIVKIITNEIDNKEDEIGEQLSGQILNFIETNSIGDIIGWSIDNNVVTPRSLTDIINNNIKNLSGKELNFLDNFLNEKIGKSLKFIDLSILKKKVLPAVFEKIKKDYIYDNRFKTTIRTGMDNKLKEIVTKKVSDIFDVEKISINLNEKSIQEKLIGFGDNLLKSEIQDILGKNAADTMSVNIEPFWNNNKKRSLNDVYKIAQNESSYQKIADGILDILNQNMEKLLSGNVSAIVNKELSKSNSDQINEMVQDFMGKELKPINFIGLALGAIIGGISVFVAAKLSVPNELVWYMFPVYAAIFAMVGMGTNAIAIRMLFRPYTSLKGLNFSPFVGVVAAKKPEFAVNISKFVKENTLNDTALKDTFNASKDNLKSGFDKYIADSNYKIIDTFLCESGRLDSLSVFIFTAIKKYIKDNSANISKSICKILKDAVESGKLDTQLPVLKEAIIEKLKEANIAGFVNNMLQNEIANKNISQYSKLFSGLIDVQVKNLFESLSHDLTIDKIKKIINEQNQTFLDYIETNTFEDLAGTKTIDGLAHGISGKMNEVIDSAVGPFVEYLQKQEFNPTQKLDEVFGGALPGFIEKNIDFVIKTLITEIKKNRDTIKNTINEKIDNDVPSLLRTSAKKHVTRLVDMLLDDEMPPFMNEKREDFLKAANSLLENRLSNLGFNRESFNKESVQKAVASVLKSASIQSSLSHLVDILVRQYAKMPIESLFKILNIRSLSDIVAIIDPLLRTGVSKLQDNIRNDQVAVVSGKCVTEIIKKMTGNVAAKDLLASVELDKELDNIIFLLKKSDDAMRIISDIFERMLYKIAGNYNFYSETILCKDLLFFLDSYNENEWALTQSKLIPVIKEILTKLNVSLTEELKDAICKDFLMTAILEACENNFNDIISSIDIKTVVEREINNMHPRQVEKMFYKFSGRYFNKLIGYGWIGAFGGLLSYGLSCLLRFFIK